MMKKNTELYLIITLAIVGVIYKFFILPITPPWADVLAAAVLIPILFFIYRSNKAKKNESNL
jgi:pilus assembly protein TadC